MEHGVHLEGVEESGQRHIEGSCDPGKSRERRGGLGVFDLGQHSLGEPGMFGQLGDGVAKLDAVGAHPLANGFAQLGVEVGRRLIRDGSPRH